MSKLFEIRKTSSKGTGVFAIQDIRAGTVILREKPILRCLNLDWPVWFSACLQLMEGIDALAPEKKAEVMNLYAYSPEQHIALIGGMVDTGMKMRKNRYPKEDYIKLSFVMKTNFFNLDVNGGQDLCGLYLDFSRINHSCACNANNDVQPAADGSQEMVIRAKEMIAKGSEITIEYLSPWTANRAAKMKETWGFSCLCPVCDKNNTNFDQKKRDTFEKMFQQIRDNDEKMFDEKASTLNQKIKRHQLRLAALKHLGPSVALLNEYSVGVPLYNIAGSKEKVIEALRASYEAMLLCVPPDDPVRVQLKNMLGR
ncbi:hypothetical protein AB5N19_07513 [Seiridium cardinale]|uniref:SET domain-containing protein n=1 Tax=Seiridium cardinale TaxID=138064 RepID=A0ABR2XTI1_9PEZI